MSVFITEYAQLARDAAHAMIAAGKEPAMANQVLSSIVTSAQCQPFVGKFIMVHADAAAHLAFGANPTAVTTAHRIGPGETRYYGVIPGQRLAAIAGS